MFSNVFSNLLSKKIQSYIGCTYLAFHHFVFLNVFSNGPHEKMHSHIGCICVTFPHCAFSNVSSKVSIMHNPVLSERVITYIQKQNETVFHNDNIMIS